MTRGLFASVCSEYGSRLNLSIETAHQLANNISCWESALANRRSILLSLRINIQIYVYTEGPLA